MMNFSIGDTVRCIYPHRRMELSKRAEKDLPSESDMYALMAKKLYVVNHVATGGHGDLLIRLSSTVHPGGPTFCWYSAFFEKVENDIFMLDAISE